MIPRRTITRLWLVLTAGGIALAAVALPDAAQDVAKHVVQDAYMGNPLAIGLVITLLLLGGLLWLANQAATIWAKVRGQGKTADHADIHAHLRQLDDSMAILRTDTVSSTAEVRSELRGLRRDVERLLGERRDPS